MRLARKPRSLAPGPPAARRRARRACLRGPRASALATTPVSRRRPSTIENDTAPFRSAPSLKKMWFSAIRMVRSSTTLPTECASASALSNSAGTARRRRSQLARLGRPATIRATAASERGTRRARQPIRSHALSFRLAVRPAECTQPSASVQSRSILRTGRTPPSGIRRLTLQRFCELPPKKGVHGGEPHHHPFGQCGPTATGWSPKRTDVNCCNTPGGFSETVTASSVAPNEVPNEVRMCGSRIPQFRAEWMPSSYTSLMSAAIRATAPTIIAPRRMIMRCSSSRIWPRSSPKSDLSGASVFSRSGRSGRGGAAAGSERSGRARGGPSGTANGRLRAGGAAIRYEVLGGGGRPRKGSRAGTARGSK